MKQEHKRGWRMAAIGIAFAIALSACSGSGGNGGKEEAGPATVGNASPSVDSGSTGAVGEPEEFTLFVNESWIQVDKWEGSAPEEITAKTGVKFKITKATDANQLAVLLASGNLPDFIYSGSMHDRLADSKVSLPIDELIAQYAPDFKIDAMRQLLNTQDDGHIYAVKNAFATAEEYAANPNSLLSPGSPGLALRKDILEQMGNPSVKTIPELIDVLRRVKQDYPDLVPMVANPYWTTQYFRAQLGVEVGGTDVYTDNGRIKYGLTHPKQLEFYKLMNQLFREGLMSPEVLAYKNLEDVEMAVSGKAFAHMALARIADSDNAAIKQAGKDYSFKQVIEPLTDDAVNVIDNNGWAGLYITKNNKNPEKAIKFLQFMFSEEGRRIPSWGVEGKDWTMNPDGYPEFKYDRLSQTDINERGLNAWIFGTDNVTDGLTGFIKGTETTDALLALKSVTKFKPELSLVVPKGDSDEKLIYDKLADMVKTEQPKVFLAATEQEAVEAYEEIVNKAEKIGMSKLEEAMTAKYAEVLKRLNP